jgi:adenosylmethionine-8-amino-7-oxononanoate aminotransferase
MKPKDRVRYPEGHVLLRNLSWDYPVVSHGEGIYLYDKAGRKYLDASGGALVVSIGHGNKEVAAKIAKQLADVSYVSGMYMTSEAAQSACEKLAKLAAPLGLERATLLSSGSEAIEAAIKFARQLWVERGKPDRSKIIARTPGYHGNTLFALSASARPHYKKFFGPLLSDVVMIPAPYEYRSEVKDYKGNGGAYYSDLLEQAILREGPDKIAAFIAEPVIGSSAGASVPPPGYFDRVQEICRRYGILIIADEVMCGAGRTGKFFASEHFNLKPDILVMGKGINAGFVPVSAVLVREDHLREMHAGSGYFMHAQTYMLVPALAATVHAVLDYFEKHKVVEHGSKIGAYMQKKLREEILPLPYVGHVGGLGMMAGIEFVEDKLTKKPFERGLRKVEKFIAHCFHEGKEGMIFWPNVGHADGVNGDLIMLGPPLTMTQKEVDEMVGLLKARILDFFSR